MKVPRFSLRTLMLVTLTLGLLGYLNFAPTIQDGPGINILHTYGFPFQFRVVGTKTFPPTVNFEELFWRKPIGCGIRTNSIPLGVTALLNLSIAILSTTGLVLIAQRQHRSSLRAVTGSPT